ncbi:MAG: serine hydroxymethyltransferase [Planctomycetes bacterium RIFCSPHIGHO2_02_FULL_50_42]|nr:MAG: serine hydroxymethyltransferase [Planctomycetes bacterium GWA2_50_13]OHB89644.1 MAG: serine hydroxymethyltransferase [Planctomycetes bacterium RIFCSPHIGHO2_02_FULL_50_42]OHB92478.1 MAG: serine hydroxymethyltransferase [Planctomycetes bacterium RIFCSPHIGHO2_12_FULL_51_37]OHB94829.1 MAG: serine hydroxymethyltransferase [Planctomycetes bacterium RIFCSPLOWO2_02_FULL_50_16]OHC02629.1 MAG: serine hydroxymethyltransferase [Planctomycetes bacterium RIFCSPLOWO2_12_FULL_50_35]
MDYSLKQVDREVWLAIQGELERQQFHLELIASENYCTPAVLEAQGSVLTNKYAEGYPNKRYYSGCDNVDTVERLAMERAKKLFGAEHVNVQPHSGSQANMAVYFAALSPEHKVLGMDIRHGGHLTHGFKKNFSGQIYEAATYGVDRETKLLDYDAIMEKARSFRPDLIIAGASAYSRTIDFAKFKEIADEVGALLLVDMAHIAGLIAGKQHPDPVPYADFVTSTTHKTLGGPRGGFILCKSKYAAKIDQMVFPGMQGGPLMHIIAAKAVGFKDAMTDEFRDRQRQTVINARALAQELMNRGYEVITGGTDNHLFLLDLTNKDISGRDAQECLAQVGVYVNKNLIPFDERGAFETSGIRLGSAAATTRGMKEQEMASIAGWIDRVLSSPWDEDVKKNVKKEVADFCAAFPVYENGTVYAPLLEGLPAEKS